MLSAMTYGLYMSAEGASAQSRRMEVLANNLANVDTVGFKRQLAVLQARHSEAILQGTDNPGSGTVNDIGGGIEVPKTLTDFSQGVLKRTDIPSDVAIDGDGFFLVENAQAEPRLTRAGNFRLTSDGNLVTPDGYAVLSQDAAPIQIAPGQPWEVSNQGVVRQGELRIPLAIVKPEHTADLAPEGENLFRPLGQVQPIPPSDRNVRAGFLEHSSVKSTSEMMEMIEASRAFESNVKLIQHQDDAIGQLLSRVLRTN